MGIALTFVLIVTTNFTSYKFSKKIRNMLNERSTSELTFNIFRIFFGIGQINVSKANFLRILLISFTFWCLVIRTAYQGKLFEFVTTAVRHPKIDTLQELRIKNFTVYLNDFYYTNLMTEFISYGTG